MHLITVFAPIQRSSIHHSKLLSSPHLFSFIASLAINSHSPSALYASAFYRQCALNIDCYDTFTAPLTKNSSDSGNARVCVRRGVSFSVCLKNSICCLLYQTCI